MTLIRFYPPADNERGPTYLETLIEGWVALVGQQGMRLGISTECGQLMFLLKVPANRQRIIAAQLENAFPGGKASIVSKQTGESAKNKITATSWLRLSPDVYPLKLHQSFIEEHSRDAFDPLEGLLEVIKSGRSGRLVTTFWLELKPLKKNQLKRAKRNSLLLDANFSVRALQRTFERHFSSSRLRDRFKLFVIRRLVRNKPPSEAVVAKLSKHLFAAKISIETRTEQPATGLHDHKAESIRATLSHLLDFSAVFFVEKHPTSSFLLNAAEIATLWHVPTTETMVPRLERNTFKELEPPLNLPRPSESSDIVTLGRVSFRNERYKFGMDLEARRRHLWILGKSGVGKSTLLLSILKQDLKAKLGFALLEPHGDLSEATLKAVPKYRKNDIVYFDPADQSNSVTFNPLMVPSGSDKTLVADGVLTAFKKVFGFDESQAPRMLHIFRNCLLSLVEMPNATLMDVQRILVEDLYRKSVIARVENPVVRSFWLDEFGKWKPHDRTAFIASLQNKLGTFLTNSKLQRILGDPKAKLDLRRIMDEGKVLIVNLSKGRLGENASDLLGTLLVTSMQLAAMSRANISEQERRDFSIVMDEFQSFTTPSIATFLSEARKYRTHLILANQYTQQIPEEILAAIIGNVGSQILFQLGGTDTQFFEALLGHSAAAAHLANTPKYHAYCRMLVNGMPSRPFSFATVIPK